MLGSLREKRCYRSTVATIEACIPKSILLTNGYMYLSAWIVTAKELHNVKHYNNSVRCCLFGARTPTNTCT